MNDTSTQIEGSDLAALIGAELSAAKRYASNELSDKRAENIEYYQGVMRDIPPAPNRSSQVSRDVTDTISWVLPGIIRVFTASDTMVMYEPAREGDEEFAQQATDYANFVFFKDNEGYRTLYNATHDALVGGNGIVYHYWDPTPQTNVTFHSGLTPQDLAVLMQDPDVEIIAQEQIGTEPVEMEVPEGIMQPGMDGAPPMVLEMPIFNVKVRRTTLRGKVCVHACKPENLFLDGDAPTFDTARFCAYLHSNKTRSDLVEMGFPREIVDDIPTANPYQDEESIVRNRDSYTLRTYALPSQDLVDLYECYVKADINDDGIAEWLQVWYAGSQGSGTVLAWQGWEDDLPFSDIPCYPVPHRWDADSVADRTKDIARVKTVLLRQALDNLYASNMPMLEAEAGTIKNPDILVKPRFGGIIWRDKNSMAASPIRAMTVPFVADKAFTAMQFMDEVIAKRTGVSRTTMALDPEALQNQSATANQNNKEAGYSQIELIARNMAELGWNRVFRALLRIIVKNQDRPRVIRLRDEYEEVDPRVWNADMNVTINTGLGTGSRDRDMQMLSAVKQDQLLLATQFQANGLTDKAIDMIPRILLTMKKTAESAGLKNPEAFYPDFEDDDKANAAALAEQAKSQPDPRVAMEQAKMQADQQQAQAKMQLEQQKMQADFELRRQQIDAEISLKREQLDAELRLKREQLQAELQLQRELGYANAQAKVAASSSVQVGGEPG